MPETDATDPASRLFGRGEFLDEAGQDGFAGEALVLELAGAPAEQSDQPMLAEIALRSVRNIRP